MNINLVLPINKTGYGVTGQNILKSLHDKGHKLSLWPIGGVEYEQEIDVPFKESVKNTRFFDRDAPSLRLYHLFDMSLFPGRGKRFGFPIYELDTFTDDEVESIKSLDALVVCSEWAKKIAQKYTDIPIHVVPLGVNRNLFFDSKDEAQRITDTVFLTCGKWEVRKGHDVLINAFNAAFQPEDKVSLLMNCYNPFIGPEGNLQWTAFAKSTPMGKKIHVIDERLPTQSHVANLMRAADCGVFPARSEGWNLELLEMMACGKEVIATDYAAHSEFASKRNCRLINVAETELAYDNVWFNGQGSWGKIGKEQFDCLVNHLREVHKKKQEGRLTINYEGIKTSKVFSWERSAEKLIEVFSGKI